MSLRPLYDKVQCLIKAHEGEWNSAIQLLAEFHEKTLESIQRERDAQAPKKAQKSGKHSCSYLANPRKVSLGKSRRSSKQILIEDTENAAKSEEPVAKSTRLVRLCRNKAIAQKEQSLDGSSSSHEHLKPKKRRVRPKKRSTSDIMVPDTPENKRSPSQASRQRASIDRCLTPRRSVGSLIPMKESRKLIERSPRGESEVVAEPSRCESVEGKAEELIKQTPQKPKRMPLAKPSSTPHQIFSPYGLDSTKKKAEAYENHIGKLAVQDIRMVKTLKSDVSDTRRSCAQKRRSSLSKPCDKLVLAKAARMSQTQRRSSLMRYHLQVAVNQVVRKVSQESRRSSLIDRKRTSCVGSENAMETKTEKDAPRNTSLHIDNFVDVPQLKKNDSKHSDILVPVVVAEKLDETFLLSKSGSKHPSPQVSKSDATTNSTVDSPTESARCSASTSKLNPQVHVERLSQKQINRATIQSPSTGTHDEISSSDSYISEDEPMPSTPVVTHFTKKVPLSTQLSRPSTYKSKCPGSEPRPVHQARVAFLASLINSSNPGKRNSSTASASRIISFLKSRPPSQDFAVKKMDKLKEEFKKKKEKEELAFQRREQMLKDKVLSHKKKRNEKMAKAAENRLQKEKEQQDKSRALELQLQQAEEKKRVQEVKRKEEMEQRRLMRIKKEAEIEERRKQDEAVKLAKIREQEALEKMRLQEQEQIKAVISHHNSSLQKKAILNSTVTKEKAGPSVASKVDMNQTYSCEGSQETENNYDITPHRTELPPEELKDPENYDIADLDSGDDTDDDTYPRKKIPKWAQGAPLKSALLQQSRKPPNLYALFPPMPNIDIDVVFGNMNPTKVRTSSAVWYSPPYP